MHKVLNGLFCFLLFFVNDIKAQELSKLNTPVSTTFYQESSPVVTIDNSTLYFIRNEYTDAGWNIFKSASLSNQRWSPPQPVAIAGNENNDQQYYHSVAVSYDQKFLFFHSEKNKDIYYSQLNGKKYSKPIPLAINTPGYEGFPSLSPDGEKLFFVRDKKIILPSVEQQCNAIYMSLKNSKGNWIGTIELPTPVNQLCEKSPLMLYDNKTLIFASNRLTGDDTYQIFRSELSTSGEWLQPELLSSHKIKEKLLKLAYINNPDRIIYNEDGNLYQVLISKLDVKSPYTLLQGKVVDKITKQPIPAEIAILNTTASNYPQMIKNDTTGNFRALIENDNFYIVKVSGKDYLDYENRQNITGSNPIMKVELLPEKIDTRFVFKDQLSGEVIYPNVLVYSNLTDTLTFNDSTYLETPIKLKKKYKVVAQLPDYKKLEETFEINDLQIYDTQVKEFTLIKENYQFYVKIFDGKGRPMTDANIRAVEKSTGFPVFPYFDNRNQAVFELNIDFDYTLTIQSDFYETYKKELDCEELVKDNAFTHQIQLTRK